MMEKKATPAWHKDPKYVKYSYLAVLATIGIFLLSLFIGFATNIIDFIWLAMAARFALTGVYFASIYCTYQFARVHGKPRWWLVPVFLFPLITIPVVYFSVKKQIAA